MNWWTFWDELKFRFGGPSPLEKVQQMKADFEWECENMKHSSAPPGEPAIIVVDHGGVYVNGVFHKTPEGKVPIIGSQGVYGYSDRKNC